MFHPETAPISESVSGSAALRGETSKLLRGSLPFRPSRARSSFFLFPAIGALCGFFLSCAAQGPPRPPRVERPERVTDLEAKQVGRTLNLSFTLPTLAEDGGGLTKPLEAEISRSVSAAGEKAQPEAEPGAPVPWLTLTPDELGKYSHDGKVFYPALLTPQEYNQWQGASFDFWVETLTHGFRHHPVESRFSKPARVALLDVSGPIENLRVVATEHALELTWTSPTHSLSGQEPHDLAGYRVLRSDTGAPGSFELRGESASPIYRDAIFQFDHTYHYVVRAVFKLGGQTAESEDSPPFVITPRDTFPPAAPAGLDAILTARGVELIWSANLEADLAGYNVYRRQDGGPLEKLTTELLGTPIYRDATAKSSHRYTYWVTALDVARNESAPSAEVTVEPQ